MCWAICKASVFDWIKKKKPNNPTVKPTTTKNLHPMCLSPWTLAVSYFYVVMMEGAESEKKRVLWYVEVLSLLQLQNILCFVFNLLWPSPFYAINFSSFGSITCQVIYHLISECFTGVSARVALPFTFGYRFFFLTNCIDDFLDRKVKQHERECALVCFLPSLFLRRNKLWKRSFVSALLSHINGHFTGNWWVCVEFKS